MSIFKKGDRADLGNYRSLFKDYITLVNLVVKLPKKLFKSRIEKYLVKNKLLLDFQHSFRKGKSSDWSTGIYRF